MHLLECTAKSTVANTLNAISWLLVESAFVANKFQFAFGFYEQIE